MSDDLICANGVNGLTGEYLIPPLEPYFREAQVSIYWGETSQFLNDMRRRIAS